MDYGTKNPAGALSLYGANFQAGKEDNAKLARHNPDNHWASNRSWRGGMSIHIQDA